MYNQEYGNKNGRFSISQYSINPWGIVILIAKIFSYGVLCCMPLIAWEILAAVSPELIANIEECKFYIMLIIYGGLAGAFVTNPSQFILRGEPWNTKIFIRRTTYEEDDDYDYGYDDESNWLTK